MLRACQKTRGILPCEVQFARFSSFFFCLSPCTKVCVCVGEKFKNKIKKRLCSAHPLSWTACGLLPFVPPLHSSALQLSGPWSFALASLSAHSLLGVGKLEAWQRESPKLPRAARWPAQAAVRRDVTPGGAAGRSLPSTSPRLSTGETGRHQAILGEVHGQFKSPPPFHTCTRSSRASYSPGFFLDQAAMQLHCMDFATRMHPYLW